MNGTTILSKSGSPTITVKDNAAGKKLVLTNRTDENDAIDIQPSKLTLSNGNEYEFAITGKTDPVSSGVKITLTATPDSGYSFKEWQIISGGVTISGNQFTMPAGNVIVKAVFEPFSGTDYTVTVDGSYASVTGAGSYAEGAEVTVSAGTRSGYTFSGWTSADVSFAGANSATTTFTMPATNVTVTANWTANNTGGGSSGGGSSTSNSGRDTTPTTSAPQVASLDWQSPNTLSDAINKAAEAVETTEPGTDSDGKSTLNVKLKNVSEITPKNVAAKIDLSGFDTEKLYIYSYDRQSGKYNLINTVYRIDAKGYLHFYTDRGDYIIVSSDPLTKRTDVQQSSDDTMHYMASADLTMLMLDNVDWNVTMTANNAVAYKMPTIGEVITPVMLKDNPVTGGAEVALMISPAVDISGEPKVGGISTGWAVFIAVSVLLSAMMLWAVIPRKDDPLISVEEYRNKR